MIKGKVRQMDGTAEREVERWWRKKEKKVVGEAKRGGRRGGSQVPLRSRGRELLHYLVFFSLSFSCLLDCVALFAAACQVDARRRCENY